MWLQTLLALSLSCALLVSGCGDDDDGDLNDPDSGIAVRGGNGGRGGGGGGGGGMDGGLQDADVDDADIDDDGGAASCDDDNGGCDELVTCTDGASGPECGDCPAGYAGDGEDGCIPALSDLTVSAGALEPAFDIAETDYALSVGLVTQRIVLTPAAPDDATIDINGESVESGNAWESDVLDLGDTEIVITVSQDDRPDRVYTITVTRSVSTTYLKASNAGADDELTSVAISGDTLVVGAPLEDSNAVDVGGDEGNDAAANSGAAYVFVRDGDGNWSQQGYLKAGNTDGGDNFGTSVAISGDTIVVGAPGEDSNATTIDGDEDNDSAAGAGAAYVFVRAGGAWSPQAYLKPSNAGGGDGFGVSVALDGDTIVVGADLEDSNAEDVDGDGGNDDAASSGAAYVFFRTGAAWAQQAYLKASNTAAGDGFGGSVAVSGDTVAVGAQFEDSNAEGVGGDDANDMDADSGAVYVFTRSGAAWSPQAYVKATNTDPSDAFGVSVALSGDTLVVGASLENGNATTVGGDQTNNDAADSGAAYVYVLSDSTWSPQAYLKAENADIGDTFGWSVAIDGDAIVVGARLEDGSGTGVDPTDDDGAIDSGAAYLFLREGTTWTQEGYLKASNTQQFDAFGQGVAISGDTIAITASEEDSNSVSDPANNDAGESGAVYVIR